MNEYLLYTDDPFERNYIVTAYTPLSAARVVANKIQKPLDEVKKIYTPILINECEQLKEK